MIFFMMTVGEVFDIKFIGATIPLEFIFGMLVFKFIYSSFLINKSAAILLILIGLSWICFSYNVEVGGDGIDRILHYGIP